MEEQYQPPFAITGSIILDQQDGYYQALQQADRAGNSMEFIEFMPAAILQTCQSAVQTADVPITDPENVPVKRRQQILSLIEAEPELTSVRLAELQRVGSLKSGYWQVMV